MPLKFVWQDLKTDFSSATQVADMLDDLHVSDMCFRKFRLLSNTIYTPRFLADVDGFAS